MSSWAQGSLLNLGARLLAVALGLLLTVVTARLGPAAQGIFAVFLAVESVLLALGSGFGVALARRLSHHGERPTAVVGVVVAACLLLGLLSALALWAASRIGPAGLHGVAWLALAAPLMFLPGNLSGLWLGGGRMAPLALLMVAPPALTLLGVLVLPGVEEQGAAHAAQAVTSVLMAWVAARLVVAAATLLAVWRGAWITWPSWAAVQHAAQRDGRFVAVIALTNVISLLNYKVDLFLVERLMGLAPTGVYSIAVSVAELLWLVSSAVTTAAYARIGQPDRAAATALALRAIRSSVLLLGLLAPALWGLAWFVVPRVLGPDYAPSLAPLAGLLPGVVLYGAASALSAWFTNHAGQPQVPALLAGVSLVLTTLLSLWAIPRFGLMGAAVATSVSYAAAMLLGLVLLRRAAGLRWRDLLRSVPASAGTGRPGQDG